MNIGDYKQSTHCTLYHTIVITMMIRNRDLNLLYLKLE